MVDRINVLVTGTGSLIGQAVIKSILRSSIREKVVLIGCDYFKGTVGGYWCEENYILPDFLDPGMEEAWVEAVIRIVREKSIKVLFVGVDFELQKFSNLKKQLKDELDCTVVVSDNEVIGIGNDKYRTYEFLVKNGLNAPETYLLDSITPDLITSYPVILKPRQGARSRGLIFVDNEESLSESLKVLRGRDYIVQQRIGSMDTEYTCGLLYWYEGFEGCIVLKRVLKEGNTVYAECSGNSENGIVDYIKRIGNILKPMGSCNLQLRTDVDGAPYLFEINPRFSGTTYMRAMLGYNEVVFIISKIAGWNTERLVPKAGRVYRFFEEHLVAE